MPTRSQQKPLRTIPTEVTAHQRFAPARFLGVTKERRGVRVHLWAQGQRMSFATHQVVHETPVDPTQLVAVHIDADMTVIVRPWKQILPSLAHAAPHDATPAPGGQAPPLLPPPAAIKPSFRVSREAVLASIEAPQTPAVEALLAGLPAGVRVGIAASTLFDYAMADIRQSLGLASFLPVREASLAAEDAHNATRYSQANRASRSSYLGIDARFPEVIRRVFSAFLAKRPAERWLGHVRVRESSAGTCTTIVVGT